jgi:hypothetical protein
MNPAFVLQGAWTETLYLSITAAIGTLFICGGLQGYQIFVGDLRASGALEWPLRILLIAGGLILATPGGGILPFSNLEMELAALAILAPGLGGALWLVRRVAP